ncbi:MAG TPA: chromosome segregation protein ScpA [Clostridiales bacterium]|nr:chromosome segregation protein ScpA [Clostridiales bacterium]
MQNPTFFLEGVVKNHNEMTDFEGPLSLILMLLSKNKIEIRDIRISEILDQYLAYIERMQELDLEVASEFVQMASHLLYIKTKTILAGEEEEVTELQQLMTSLEQLRCRDLREAVKSVVPEFAAACEAGMQTYTRPQEQIPRRAEEYEYHHDPADLFKSLFAVFSRAGARAPAPREMRRIAPQRIIYGIREKCREIISLLKDGRVIPLRTLFAAAKSRSEVVATFISVLELCAAGTLLLGEKDGEIDVAFTGEDTDADEIIEAIEE